MCALPGRGAGLCPSIVPRLLSKRCVRSMSDEIIEHSANAVRDRAHIKGGGEIPGLAKWPKHVFRLDPRGEEGLRRPLRRGRRNPSSPRGSKRKTCFGHLAKPGISPPPLMCARSRTAFAECSIISSDIERTHRLERSRGTMLGQRPAPRPGRAHNHTPQDTP